MTNLEEIKVEILEKIKEYHQLKESNFIPFNTLPT